MIRVLIAEDEPPTLRRIKRMIEQSDPELSVAATASDGEQALALMEQTPCDIVFSDIRMPVMDGLALMDRIREKWPDCQVVIISGYKDFSYVTHAMRSRAVDYLLKPVSQPDLDALVARLKETHARRERERLSRQLSATMNRSEAVKWTDMRADENARFDVCLFCAGAMPLQEDAERLEGSAVFDRVLMEELLLAVCPDYHGFSWAFMGNSQGEQILILQAEDMRLSDIASKLMQAIERDTRIPISCACTSASVPLREIGKAIHLLRATLSASVRIGKGTLVMVDEAEPAKEVPEFSQDTQEMKQLAAWLMQDRTAGGEEAWQALLARMEQEAWTEMRVYSLFGRAFARIEAKQGASEDLTQARNLMTEVIETALSWGDIAEGVSGLVSLLGGEEGAFVTQNNVAAKVAQYLDAHYAEHINNQTLGQVFGYVPSYISLLFRKEYGISPAEYLTRARLDRAKAMMQDSPEMLIRDIAEQVGFKSPHHFSRTFKKYEGVWPTGYPQ